MRLRRVVQGLALLLFVFLAMKGKQQVWMLLFLLGVVGALWLGRFYCAWLCPINTTMDVVDRIYQKLGISRREVPAWAKKKWVRNVMLGLFLMTMVFVLATGRKIPVLVILTLAGVGLSLFYVPAFWHRYLCPYGTILNFTGKWARNFYFVDQENCVRCGKCKKACPAEAIIMESPKEYPFIDKGLCLECTECVLACPKDTIKYVNQKVLG
ncbi:MAG: 4Fe-4S binding protein [Bacillota bacterium]|nr:4Fe-4S binding protein [Bacillota bacterium]